MAFTDGREPASEACVLTYTRHGSTGPLIVFLHWLGGSAKTWNVVCEQLAAAGARSIAVDLPGFGDAAEQAPADTLAMADAVEQTLGSLLEPAEQYLLVGHSMGGKVASLIARRAEGRATPEPRPLALLLVSSSPPAPEPMTEAKRAEITRELGNADRSEDARGIYALRFVRENLGKLSPGALCEEEEARRMVRSAPAAFWLWAQRSSKQDCRELVGTVELKTLILAGSEDAALGPKAQQELTLPHFSNGRLEVLEGAGHLAPLERPAELVLRIAQLLRGCGVAVGRDLPLSHGFSALLHSARTSQQTREVMQERLEGKSPADVFGPELSITLQALVNCVVPVAGFDLRARLEQTLAAGEGDGWRFDALPADREAWRRGLATLDHASVKAHGVNFAALPSALQTALLKEVQAGKLSKSLLGALHLGEQANDLNGEQMKAWFEEVRSEACKQYASDPRTMDRVGFAGFADDDLIEITEAATGDASHA